MNTNILINQENLINKTNHCTRIIDLFYWQNYYIKNNYDQMLSSLDMYKNDIIVISSVNEINLVKNKVLGIYISGDLSRQTDILQTLNNYEGMIYLERGSFLSTHEIINAYQKIKAQNVCIIDNGFNFGIDRNILDIITLHEYNKNNISFGIKLSQKLLTITKNKYIEEIYINDIHLINSYIKATLVLNAQNFIFENEKTLMTYFAGDFI